MKRALAHALVTLVLCAVGVFVAAQVDLVDFEAGELIRADEVNANFAALAGALDAKQVRITGECPEGSAIRVVNADGSAECEADDVGTGGGGITAVVAGDGLSGGGASGSVELALDAAFTDARYYTRAEVDGLLADALAGTLGGVQRVSSGINFTLPPGSGGGAGVSCPAGSVVLGGGVEPSTIAVSVNESFPSSDTRWFVTVSNTSDASVSGSATLWAVCATVN